MLIPPFDMPRQEVIIDATFFRTDTFTGVWKVVENCIRSLHGVYAVTLLARKDTQIPQSDLSDKFAVKRAKCCNSGFLRILYLFFTAIRASFTRSIILYPNISFVFPLPVKQYVIVHDLKYSHRSSRSRFKNLILDLALMTIGLFAFKIIVPSQDTKSSLANFYGKQLGWQRVHEKILTILNPVESNNFQMNVRGHLRDFSISHPPDSPYINTKILNLIYLGHVRPEKGVLLAIRVSNMLNSLLNGEHNVYLSVVGPLHQSFDLKKSSESLNLDLKFVKIYGYVDEKTKLDLLSASDFLLFPSLVEGFGIPVLEALYSGCIPILPLSPPFDILFDGCSVQVSYLDYVSDAVGEILAYSNGVKAFDWNSAMAFAKTRYSFDSFALKLRAAFLLGKP